ncbi:MAG TPA: trypsin-like peptidase domain-containing protein, partial [Tepidisphaeraceae bacterium]
TVFPAVVRIDVAQEVYSDGKRNIQRGIGSGVIIDADGHIMTNYHVAGRAVELLITLYSKERIPAKLVGDDHWTDIAIVQLDMNIVRQRHIHFAYAPLGDSSTLRVGQSVAAIGTPFGLERTMTLGIVSNNERTFYPEKQTIDEFETGEFSNWIQMDTPIAPGNSGGPLVDMYGKIVGINTLGILGEGLNFAIPIDTAKEVARKILATARPGHLGHVDRSDLGLDFQPMQDVETSFDTDIDKGVLISNVERNSPAEKAGVRTQDILLAINGAPINVRFPEEIAPAYKHVADLPIGSDVHLTIKRDNQILHMNARTEKLQGAVGEEREFKAWGLSVREVTRAYANANLLDDVHGVVVTTLSRDDAAAEAQVQSGDIIHAVNTHTINDLADFAKVYDESTAKHDKKVFFQMQRGRGIVSALLKIASNPKP